MPPFSPRLKKSNDGADFIEIITIQARALDAFEKTHRRGIGTAVARHLVRSSAPAWHLIADTLDSPWTVTVLRTATSLLALAMFCATIIAAFMLTS